MAATLVVAGLTGCAGSSGSGADCVNPLQPGPLSDAVTLHDGSAPSFAGPKTILNAQRSVLTAGKADATAAVPGGIVTANVTMYDAATGKVIDKRENAPHLVLPEKMLGDVKKALAGEQSDSMSMDYLIATSLLCAVPGQTIAVAATGAQSMASQLGMTPTVAVIDVLQAAPDHSQGAARGLPAGFPAVAVDQNGRPGVVLPPQAGPTKMQVAVRIMGDGAKVTAKSSIIGQALTVNWNNRSVASNTWESGITGFGTEENANPEYGFRAELTGYPVGSQLVILDPNKGDPLVHVVDIVSAS
ncbi:MAG: hypothetical protein J0H64_01885 [Actinobacteria bacterium]|nr:hypothetical protein [Actinomycetota bacterium]